MQRLMLFIILSIFFVSALAAETIELQKMRISNAKNKTRLVVELSSSVYYKVFSLKNPNRIVVDLLNTHMSHKEKLSNLNLKKSLIKSIRTAKHEKNTLRLVFDTEPKLTVSSFLLKADKKKGIRLVVDIKRGQQASVKHNQVESEIQKNIVHHIKKKLKPIAKVLMPQSHHLRKVIVVVDPGHGGQDPGAMGPHRTREKQVVLAIARRLRDLINRQPGMRAVMTRRGDYYLQLRQRLDIARKNKADVFVSIHADAFQNNHSHGASVFALSQRGASSEAAKWLAQRENYSELGGVKLNDKSYLLRSVLLDLSQTATIGYSLKLGTAILNQIGQIATLHNEKVEQARFVVLKSPDIPSILIETGFISNRQEERNLVSPRYQEHLARSILKGLKAYFWNQPPPGTLLEAARHATVYRVLQGDTLSKIAHQHYTTVMEIKDLNQLGENALRIGQTLKIPRVNLS